MPRRMKTWRPTRREFLMVRDPGMARLPGHQVGASFRGLDEARDLARSLRSDFGVPKEQITIVRLKPFPGSRKPAYIVTVPWGHHRFLASLGITRRV